MEYGNGDGIPGGSQDFGAVAATLVAGCGKKDDSIAQAGKQDAAEGAPAPSIAETKTIAEEAFIYGLPLVMNYAVLQEFVFDKNSGQCKPPFNTISNEARVFTYKDTAVVTPNSDTPYSMLWLDLRAEPMVISVPAVEKKRYYSMQLTDGNAYNYGYIGSRATGVEDSFRLWRFRHVTTVERVIGFKRGTVGTSGVGYLRKMLDVVLFPEIRKLRTDL